MFVEINFVFWVILGLWALSPFVVLLNEKSGDTEAIGCALAFVFVAPFALAGIYQIPWFYSHYFLLYPVIGLVWMLFYWYLHLKRSAATLQKDVTEWGGLKKYKEQYGELKIKHPFAGLLVLVAIFWPQSILYEMFFGFFDWLSLGIQEIIKYCKTFMNKIRDSIVSKIK